MANDPNILNQGKPNLDFPNPDTPNLHSGSLPLAWLGPFVLAVGVLGLSSCGSPRVEELSTAGGVRGEAVELEPCHLSSPGSPGRLEADCGFLILPEDPSNPEGASLEVHFAVVEAIHRSPHPDPLFLLAGGPGQAAMEAFVSLSGAFAGVLQKRDLVLVDQRGTGRSNALTCPEDSLNPLEVPSPEELRAHVDGCREQLSGDPRFYTTSIAMEDLDAVREALGYESINLYGVSYGTRAALTYLRAFPEHTRSVVLDGVAPQDLALGETWARDAQRSFSLIHARCQENEACGQKFGDLQEVLSQLLDRLTSSPETVSVDHPTSGESLELTVDGETLAALVHRFSYSPETVSLLPLLLYEAHATGDFRRIAAQAVLFQELGLGMSEGMSHAVLCTEDVPFIDLAEARRLNQGTYLGDLQLDQMSLVCQGWPRGDLRDDYKQPVVSDKPVLLLSGEADPVTPPEYGDRVAATLSQSLHLVVPGIGHNVLPHGCVPDLVEEFIEAGSFEGLETSCVEAIEPPPFFLNPSGPNP
ncbi:MAG: alpha/beta hydrolase [Deltaproteobacteria bacterium]|nr:alpha/beta hydrolase [Deltaproteobacteria bacterium]